MRCLLFLLLLSPLILRAQAVEQPSFFIIGSGSDGIMLATDSRTGIYTTQPGIRYGYHDYAIKSAIIGNTAIAFLGTEVFSGVFLYSIIEDFKKESTKLEVPTVLPALFAYCKRKMSPKDYELLSKNRFVVVGYEGGMPTICMQDGSISRRECVAEGWIRIASDPSDFETTYKDTLSCVQLAVLAEKAINNFAKEYSEEGTIGGPIRVIKITTGGANWLQNKPQVQWKTLQDQHKDFTNGKLNYVFSSKANKDKFSAQLQKQ